MTPEDMYLARPENIHTLRETFDARWTADPETGCWVWQGSMNPDGYGRMCYRRKSQSAHRWAWAVYREPVPVGMVLDHICRNRRCVNPDHLRVVTRRTNVLVNSLSNSAINAAKTHCVNGHALAGDNVRFERDGRRRVCRRCAANKQRRYLRRAGASR